jgi:hypothetical protein
MQWLRDNKFILDVILDTPDALSHVIGHPPPPPLPPTASHVTGVCEKCCLLSSGSSLRHRLRVPSHQASRPPCRRIHVTSCSCQMVAASGVHFDR